MTATTEGIETSTEPATHAGAPGPASGTWVQLCTHIMPTGATCGCPAVGGTKLCFHHTAVKTALGRVTPIDQVPYGVFSPIPFVFAEDAASLQINYQLLLQAVAEKRTDHRTGTLLFRILHDMAANLKNPLIAENPATHGEGDKINVQAHEETAPQPPEPRPESSEPEPKSGHADAPHLEEMWDQSSGATATESPSEPAAPAPASTPKTKARPEDDPALKAAIEALPSATRDNVNHFLNQRGYLSDGELQYFSLPPYDKPENKPEPWLPDPLSPSVQRVIALACDRP